MAPRDEDKAAILRRRAALVSSALSALSCSPGTPPQNAGGAVVAVPEPAPDAAPPQGDLPEPEPKPAVPTRRPPLSVPGDIGDGAREVFERSMEQARQVYDELDAVRAAIPESCDLVSDPACQERWREVADRQLQAADTIRWLNPVCTGSSEDAKRWEARVREHLEYIAALRTELEEQIASALEPGGDAAAQRWEQIQSDARRARPQVCLSFACSDW